MYFGVASLHEILVAFLISVDMCAGTTSFVYGVNTSFTVLGDVQTFELPLLLWSQDHTHVKFNYGVKIDGSLKVHEDVACFSDLEGTSLLTQWSQDISLDIKSGYDHWHCFSLINYIENPNHCVTFRAKMRMSADITISNIQFGDETVCSTSPVQRQAVRCSFDSGDCGIRNDGCGMVPWRIDAKSAHGSKRSSSCDQAMSGIPLLKNQISSTCSYHVQIPKLQPSGFTLINITSSDTIDLQTGSRRRRAAGYGLYLIPGGSGSVAFGSLILPTVTHGSNNKFMTFYHDMVVHGVHDLIVTAVCVSDPANPLIPLAPGGLHYHKQNFDGSGSSGTVCLTIHDYVSQGNCPQFAIQMEGAAYNTVLEIDDIDFQESSCGVPDNT